jgi:ABC-2 type transport system ATP-binding protein
MPDLRMFAPSLSANVPHAIAVTDLTKTYGHGTRTVQAVRGISFTVPSGSTTALLGGNGAGKTTTISMLLGVLAPTSGSVYVLGHDMASDRHAALARMNLTSPYVDLPKRLTVGENLDVFARLYGAGGNAAGRRARIERLVEEYSLQPLMKRAYGDLSAGQRTRVSLAKALVNEPEVLLLDEPTASLDPDVADTVRSRLQAYQARTGATFLLASHHMGEVERLANDVLMMKGGQVVDQGSPAHLLGKYGRSNLEDVFLDIARDRTAFAEGNGSVREAQA